MEFQVHVANVDRCLELLETLAGHSEGGSLGSLAEALDLPKSAAHRLLHALAARGYVVQDSTTQDYRLSLKLATLAFRHIDAGRLPDLAQAALDRLARRCGEYCRIALVEGSGLGWVARAQGATQGLRYEPAMDRDVVLHATATGKAWLATLTEEQALAIVYQRGFTTPPGFGPRAISTVDELRAHLDETRKRGHALAVDEGEPGTVAIATTFRTFVGVEAPVAGTVSVAGPRSRIDDARLHELAPMVVDAARELTELWPLRRRQRTAERAAARVGGPAMAQS
jgi:IclR family transcriptional regulator, acetate operon repressor